MFGDSQRDRARKLFADQFQPDGADFLYRRNMRGSAYRVSRAERDALIAAYDRAFRRFIWGTVAGTLVLLFALIAITTWLGFEPDRNGTSPLVILAICVPVMLLAVVFNRYTYGAPARLLSGRTPVTEALSEEAKRKLTFGRMTWGQVATAAGASAVLPFIVTDWHPFDGWNRLWLVMGFAGLVLAAVQGFRKWQFERDR